MGLIHHGGHDGVTGSCHQWQLDSGRSVLVDCGLFQGNDARKHPRLEIEFPLDGVDGLVLTHVHIDHAGRLPYLMAAGFERPIYCSQPTARLLPLMLEDSLKSGFTRNARLIEAFLQRIDRYMEPLPFGSWHDMGNGAAVRLHPAGHILGSAYVELDAEGKRVVFSGDLGAPHAPLVFDNLTTVGSHGEHQDTLRYLKKSRIPAIVIAGSGMCTGGRVVNYLKAFLKEPLTDVLFVGYQGAGTPGRQIQDRRDWVEFDGQRFQIRAKVHTLSGYSAHADQQNLLDFVSGMSEPPAEIVLVHGEAEPKRVLREKLEALGLVVRRPA